MNIACVKETKRSFFILKLHLCIKIIYSFFSALLSPLAFLLKTAGICVVDVKFEALGHLAVEPDLFLREKQSLGKKCYPVLFAPYRSFIKEQPFSTLVCNPFLLRCWSRHFYVIDNLFLYLLLHPLLKSPILQYSPYHYLAPKTSPEYRKGRDYISIYNETAGEQGEFKPLLQLTEEEEKRGKTILKEMGLSEKSWFVCFSAREQGYYTKENQAKSSCRNGSIDRLYLSLDEVIQRGGFCIRVGSPLAPPLPSFMQNDHILDYPKSKYHSDFMDVYLAAKCRFSIGMISGLTELPRVFGVPSVLFNIVPFGTLSPLPSSLHLFKLHKSISGELIPFEQCLKSYLASSTMDEDYREFKVELVENEPEEIRDAVVEMLERLDGTACYSIEEENLQEKFHSCMNSFNPSYGASSRVAKAFLQKYAGLIEKSPLIIEE